MEESQEPQGHPIRMRAAENEYAALPPRQGFGSDKSGRYWLTLRSGVFKEQ